MFYFIHATTMDNFKKILESGYIYAPKYAPFEIQGLSGIQSDSDFVFTNVFTDGLHLKWDEKMGIGRVTIIIDPLILKYKICFFNPQWYGYLYKETIIMNDNVDEVLNLVKKNYRYPFVTSHEALFWKSISIKFMIGAICEKKYQPQVRNVMDENGYNDIPIFNNFPRLVE